MKKIVLWALLFLVLLRLITAPYPFDGTAPLSTDHQTYLHHVQMIKDNGFVKWDQYWYGGMPFLRFYPPLSFSLVAFLPIDEMMAYKLVLLLFWAIAPITAYLFFKELDLSHKQTITATAIFSLSVFASVRFTFAGMPTFVAIPFGLMFLRHFIRLVKKNNRLDLLLATLFLSATILTHVVPALLVGIISIIYLLFANKNLKSALYSYVFAFLITCFWIIPHALELKYGNSLEAPQLTIFSPINFFYDTFGYYFNYAALIAAALGVILITAHLLQKKKNNFAVATLIAVFAGYFATYNIFGDRVLIISALPIAIMLATLKKAYKPLVVSFIILEGILFLAYLFPPTTADLSDEIGLAKFLSGTDGRVAVIPPGTSYLDYVLPKYGVPVTYGGYKPGLLQGRAIFLEGVLELNLNCKKSLGLSEVFSDIDLLSKRAAVTDKECTFTVANISENLGKAYAKHVVVDNDYETVLAFFNNNSDFQKEFSNARFTAYKFLGKSEMVSGNSTQGAISQTWYPYWTAEGFTLSPDEYGFTDYSGSGQLSLVYSEPCFYDWLKIISLASLIGVVWFTVRKPSFI